MVIAAHAHYDVVHFLYTASQTIQEGNSAAVWNQVAPNLDRLRESEAARPLIDLAESGNEAPSCEDIAFAVRASILNLEPLVGGLERRLLADANARLTRVIGNRMRSSASGFFLKEDFPLERDLREAVFISVGGAAHDANNTLTVLSATVQLARRYHAKILRLALGTDTVEKALEEIERKTAVLQELVRDLRRQIDSMRAVRTETTEDLKALLLSGGHVDRIFSRLAEVRLFLGRVQKRLYAAFSQAGPEDVRSSALKLAGDVANGIDLVRLSASLFRGLLETRHVYGVAVPVSSSPADPHAYLRPGILQAALGKHIELSLRLAPDPWDVPGPSARIWQVVLNLAVNARKAMDHAGALEVSTENVSFASGESPDHHYQTAEARRGDYVRLRVRDTGPGIPLVRIEEVFGLFHSGTDSSGYGLAVTRRLVHEMGGFIGVDSRTEDPDRGTAFSIYLPRAV